MIRTDTFLQSTNTDFTLRGVPKPTCRLLIWNYILLDLAYL